MGKQKKPAAAWRPVEPAGPCIRIHHVINRRNARDFDPFTLLSICYCGKGFVRGEDLQRAMGAEREAVNYQITGVVHPPELEGEETEPSRWIGVIGGLRQAEPSETVEVLNMELWMKSPKGGVNENKRFELGSEQVPLVHFQSADVRVLCGRFNDTEGACAHAPQGTHVLDVTLTPGAEFSFAVPPDNTTFVYVFGGKARFGRKGRKKFGRDSLLRCQGGEVYASTRCDGARFLLFSGTPADREQPAGCPAEKQVCRIADE